jgi:hypothetical protein
MFIYYPVYELKTLGTSSKGVEFNSWFAFCSLALIRPFVGCLLYKGFVIFLKDKF